MVWTKDCRPGITVSSSGWPAACTVCVDKVFQFPKDGLVAGCEFDLGQGILVCLVFARGLL